MLQRNRSSIATGVLLVIVAGLTLGPAVMLVVGSFSEGLGALGAFTVEKYAEVYTDPRLYRVVTNTVIFTLGSALLATTLAFVLAYLNFRTDIPFRGALHLIPIVSMMVPHLAFGTSWALLLNPSNGIINIFLRDILGLGVINVYSMAGMIFVEGLLDLPIAYLVIAAAMSSFNSSMEEASWTSGASRARTLRRIVLPMLRPALLAAVILVIIRALSAFAIPSVLGLPGQVEVMTTYIYRLVTVGFLPDFGKAAAVGVSVLASAVVLVFVYRYLTAASERFVTISGRGYTRSTIHLGKLRYPLGLFTLLVAGLLIVLPVVVLLYTSLVPYMMVPSAAAFEMMTLRHWEFVSSDALMLRALRNSIFLAVVGATLGVVLSAFVSYLIVRVRTTASSILEILTFMSFAFPGLVIGIGFMWFFVRTDLYATIWALLIAYIATYLPFGIRPLTSTFIQISKELEDASAMSGAGFLRTFRRIIAPLALPGLVSGWTLMAVMFVRELDVSVILARPGSEVLSVQMYSAVQDALWGRVAALGMIMIAISSTLVGLASLVTRRMHRAE